MRLKKVLKIILKRAFYGQTHKGKALPAFNPPKTVNENKDKNMFYFVKCFCLILRNAALRRRFGMYNFSLGVPFADFSHTLELCVFCLKVHITANAFALYIKKNITQKKMHNNNKT